MYLKKIKKQISVNLNLVVILKIYNNSRILNHDTGKIGQNGCQKRGFWDLEVPAVPHSQQLCMLHAVLPLVRVV